MHQFIKLDELIDFCNFHGGQLLNGEDNGPRVQPVTCYKFKMDWIIFRLIQCAKCIFHAQRVLVDDGIVDEDTVDTLLDLFTPILLLMMQLWLPSRTLIVSVMICPMKKPEF